MYLWISASRFLHVCNMTRSYVWTPACMCIYSILVNMHIRMYIHICINTCIYICIYLHIYKCICICVYIYIAYMYICTYTYVYIYAWTYTYIYIYIYIYTYIYMHIIINLCHGSFTCATWLVHTREVTPVCESAYIYMYTCK